MGFTPVDYHPFATQYDTPNGPAMGPRRPGTQPPAPRATLSQTLPYEEPGLTEPWTREQVDQAVRGDPGVRTARGLADRGKAAQSQMIIDDMKRRYGNNPGAMAMIKFLDANGKYGDVMTSTLKRMTPRGQQQGPQPRPFDEIDPATQAVAPPYQGGMEMPIQQRGQEYTPQNPRPVYGRPQQRQPMMPRPGMVLNGHVLLDATRPNDRNSWKRIDQ